MLIVCVVRYYEDGGFSTIAVDSMDIEMGEILTMVMRKRRLQIHGNIIYNDNNNIGV